MRRVPVLLVLALFACGGDDTVALFELPGSGSDFYSLPFPNDLRRDADGTISLADHPRPNELTAQFIDATDDHVTGFSLNPVAFFRFDGAIDVDSLPPTPQDSLSADASVYLIDIDPDSPEEGTRIPIKCRFETAAGSVIEPNWLAVEIYPGFVLRDLTTYAVVVTTRVTSHGAGVARDLAFDDMVRGRAAAEVADVYQPLVDALGESLAGVASAAVFTTQDATGLLRAAREVVRSGDEPVPYDVEVFAQNDDYAQYDGLWDAPNFQEGEPPYRREGGSIQLDDDGRPMVQRMESLRFSVTVPIGDPPVSGWPVVIYSHGTGGDYHTFSRNGTARRLARVGVAAISMDQVLHGPRDPTASSPDVNFFNFVNPASARDNALQGAIDSMNQTRLVEAFDYTDADNSRTIHFDRDHIMFFGHSQGSITGVPFLGVEPDVKAAVLSGAGGVLKLGLLHKTEPVDITALVSTIIRDQPLDEFNPVLAILQTYLDRADGINYARSILREPLPGASAKDVFLGEGFVDHYAPTVTTDALAVALGVDRVGPDLEPIAGFDVAGRASLEAPISGNVDGATGAVLQYEQQDGSDGHFVLFDRADARSQSIGFLRSAATSDTATVPAP